MKAILDFETLGAKVEELAHEQVHASDENALQETLERSCQFANSGLAAEGTANRAQKTLDALHSTVCALSEKGGVATAGGEETVLPPLRKLAAAEGAALRARIFDQLDQSEGGLSGLQKSVDDLLQELHRRERDVCQRQERLREIIAQAELLLLPEAAAETRSWIRRVFSHEKRSSLAPCWNESSRWRLELVVLQGQRYLWHTLHGCLTVLHEQFREMRQEMQAISQELPNVPPQAEASRTDGNWVFENLLKNAWKELLGKHQRVLAGKLERRLRRMILADYLSVEGTVAPKGLSAKARAESLRQAVRLELGSLLHEVDLAGLVLSSDASAEAPSPLKTMLEHAQSPRHADYGGAQRLLVACPAGAAMDTIKKNVEAAVQASPSMAQASGSEFVFCYEVERVPPRRIAAQLLQNHDDCRAIAAKLRARIDVAWPRDF
jgi:hypothetical protein